MKNEIEMKVYGVDIDKVYKENVNLLNPLKDNYLGDDEFMEISEEHGLIWTLEGFAYAYNNDDIERSVYIRFI